MIPHHRRRQKKSLGIEYVSDISQTPGVASSSRITTRSKSATPTRSVITTRSKSATPNKNITPKKSVGNRNIATPKKSDSKSVHSPRKYTTENHGVAESTESTFSKKDGVASAEATNTKLQRSNDIRKPVPVSILPNTSELDNNAENTTGWWLPLSSSLRGSHGPSNVLRDADMSHATLGPADLSWYRYLNKSQYATPRHSVGRVGLHQESLQSVHNDNLTGSSFETPSPKKRHKRRRQENAEEFENAFENVGDDGSENTGMKKDLDSFNIENKSDQADATVSSPEKTFPKARRLRGKAGNTKDFEDAFQSLVQDKSKSSEKILVNEHLISKKKSVDSSLTQSSPEKSVPIRRRKGTKHAQDKEFEDAFQTLVEDKSKNSEKILVNEDLISKRKSVDSSLTQSSPEKSVPIRRRKETKHAQDKDFESVFKSFVEEISISIKQEKQSPPASLHSQNESDHEEDKSLSPTKLTQFRQQRGKTKVQLAVNKNDFEEAFNQDDSAHAQNLARMSSRSMQAEKVSDHEEDKSLSPTKLTQFRQQRGKTKVQLAVNKNDFEEAFNQDDSAHAQNLARMSSRSMQAEKVSEEQESLSPTKTKLVRTRRQHGKLKQRLTSDDFHEAFDDSDDNPRENIVSTTPASNAAKQLSDSRENNLSQEKLKGFGYKSSVKRNLDFESPQKGKSVEEYLSPENDNLTPVRKRKTFEEQNLSIEKRFPSSNSNALHSERKSLPTVYGSPSLDSLPQIHRKARDRSNWKPRDGLHFEEAFSSSLAQDLEEGNKTRRSNVVRSSAMHGQRRSSTKTASDTNLLPPPSSAGHFDNSSSSSENLPFSLLRRKRLRAKENRISSFDEAFGAQDVSSQPLNTSKKINPNTSSVVGDTNVSREEQESLSPTKTKLVRTRRQRGRSKQRLTSDDFHEAFDDGDVLSPRENIVSTTPASNEAKQLSGDEEVSLSPRRSLKTRQDHRKSKQQVNNQDFDEAFDNENDTSHSKKMAPVSKEVQELSGDEEVIPSPRRLLKTRQQHRKSKEQVNNQDFDEAFGDEDITSHSKKMVLPSKEVQELRDEETILSRKTNQHDKSKMRVSNKDFNETFDFEDIISSERKTSRVSVQFEELSDDGEEEDVNLPPRKMLKTRKLQDKTKQRMENDDFDEAFDHKNVMNRSKNVAVASKQVEELSGDEEVSLSPRRSLKTRQDHRKSKQQVNNQDFDEAFDNENDTSHSKKMAPVSKEVQELSGDEEVIPSPRRLLKTRQQHRKSKEQVNNQDFDEAFGDEDITSHSKKMVLPSKEVQELRDEGTILSRNTNQHDKSKMRVSNKDFNETFDFEDVISSERKTSRVSVQFEELSDDDEEEDVNLPPRKMLKTRKQQDKTKQRMENDYFDEAFDHKNVMNRSKNVAVASKQVEELRLEEETDYNILSPSNPRSSRQRKSSRVPQSVHFDKAFEDTTKHSFNASSAHSEHPSEPEQDSLSPVKSRRHRSGSRHYNQSGFSEAFEKSGTTENIHHASSAHRVASEDKSDEQDSLSPVKLRRWRKSNGRTGQVNQSYDFNEAFGNDESAAHSRENVAGTPSVTDQENQELSDKSEESLSHRRMTKGRHGDSSHHNEDFEEAFDSIEPSEHTSSKIINRFLDTIPEVSERESVSASKLRRSRGSLRKRLSNEDYMEAFSRESIRRSKSSRGSLSVQGITPIKEEEDVISGNQQNSSSSPEVPTVRKLHSSRQSQILREEYEEAINQRSNRRSRGSLPVPSITPIREEERPINEPENESVTLKTFSTIRRSRGSHQNTSVNKGEDKHSKYLRGSLSASGITPLQQEQDKLIENVPQETNNDQRPRIEDADNVSFHSLSTQPFDDSSSSVPEEPGEASIKRASVGVKESPVVKKHKSKSSPGHERPMFASHSPISSDIRKMRESLSKSASSKHPIETQLNRSLSSKPHDSRQGVPEEPGEASIKRASVGVKKSPIVKERGSKTSFLDSSHSGNQRPLFGSSSPINLDIRKIIRERLSEAASHKRSTEIQPNQNLSSEPSSSRQGVFKVPHPSPRMPARTPQKTGESHKDASKVSSVEDVPPATGNIYEQTTQQYALSMISSNVKTKATPLKSREWNQTQEILRYEDLPPPIASSTQQVISSPEHRDGSGGVTSSDEEHIRKKHSNKVASSHSEGSYGDVESEAEGEIAVTKKKSSLERKSLHKYISHKSIVEDVASHAANVLEREKSSAIKNRKSNDTGGFDSLKTGTSINKSLHSERDSGGNVLSALGMVRRTLTSDGHSRVSNSSKAAPLTSEKNIEMMTTSRNAVPGIDQHIQSNDPNNMQSVQNTENSKNVYSEKQNQKASSEDILKKFRERQKEVMEMYRAGEFKPKNTITNYFPTLSKPIPKPTSTQKKTRTSIYHHPDFLIDGKVYKPPRLARPASWATTRLYKLFMSKLEAKYDSTSSRVKAEKLVLALNDNYKVIMRRKKNYETFVHNMKQLLVDAGVCDTILNWLVFVEDYMPFEFRNKVILCARGFGKVTGLPTGGRTVHDPLIPE